MSHSFRTAAKLASIVMLALLATGCASTTPVVYNKSKDSMVMSERARQVVGECQRRADAAVGRNGLNAGQAARRSGQAASIGFLATAVGSAVANSRDIWQRARGAAAAGGIGMAAKLVLDWNEGDEVYQKYVERCLDRRGHAVLGWR